MENWLEDLNLCQRELNLRSTSVVFNIELILI